MKKQWVSKLVVAAMLAGAVCSTSAVTVNLSQALGAVIYATPSNPNNEAEMIRYMVAGHNTWNVANDINFFKELGDNPADPKFEYNRLLRTYASDLPLPIVFDYKNDNNDNTLQNLATYQYIFAKYGEHALIWYIGDLPQDGNVNLPARIDGFGGLSHSSFFNRAANVPDGGATAALLGLGLLGLAGLRRKS